MVNAKPVLIEDTKFPDFIPIGKGVLVFSDLEEAVEQINKIKKILHFIVAKQESWLKSFLKQKKVLSSLLSII